jgi:hypothetical protein
MRWGKVVYLNVHRDTQLVEVLCQRLAEQGIAEALAPPIKD